MKTVTAILVWSLLTVTCFNPVHAEVTSSAADGFQIKITKTTAGNPRAVFARLVNDLSRWWDADHSYSGQAENFSMDLEKQCMLEKLPDGGFVRHMEIVFYQPGKILRLTGGLGPLQEMGVSGAMTFSFTEAGDKTDIELTYNVAGSEAQNLDKLGPAVDFVLNQQMDRLKKYCDQSSGR
jgi:uncharacterized protein YndB with AHSA1/START domain